MNCHFSPSSAQYMHVQCTYCSSRLTLFSIRYGFGHGQFNEVCMYIPALFMGPQVKKGYQITSYTTNKDFAPTALPLDCIQDNTWLVRWLKKSTKDCDDNCTELLELNRQVLSVFALAFRLHYSITRDSIRSSVNK